MQRPLDQILIPSVEARTLATRVQVDGVPAALFTLTSPVITNLEKESRPVRTALIGEVALYVVLELDSFGESPENCRLGVRSKVDRIAYNVCCPSRWSERVLDEAV